MIMLYIKVYNRNVDYASNNELTNSRTADNIHLVRLKYGGITNEPLFKRRHNKNGGGE